MIRWEDEDAGSMDMIMDYWFMKIKELVCKLMG